jgi:hypothetical protein
MSTCQSPCELVSSGWQLSQNYASTAFMTAQNFINDMGPAINMVAEIPPVNMNVEFPSANFSSLNLPNVPVEPNMNFAMPSEPGEVALTSVSPINPPSVPQFLAQFPAIQLPGKPLPLQATAPGDPPAINDIAVPDSPAFVIPDVPTLRSFDLPEAPTLQNVTFLEDRPSADIAIPTGSFNFVEQGYQSDLLDSVKNQLKQDIQQGRLGIHPAIETAIWDRARAREAANVERMRHEALEGFAARGFSLPGGVLTARLQPAEQEAAHLDSSQSRDVAIEQARMAQQHLQFALMTAVQLEEPLINYANAVSQRAWETQKAILEASISIFNARIQKFQSDVQAYATYAQIFKTRVEAELTKLQQYRTELEARKLIGDLNLQDLEAFKAQIGAIEQIVRVYSTEVSAVRERVSIESLKLEQHKSKVETFTAQVRAKAEEYNAFATEIQGEMAKVNIFDTQARAYHAQVSGYRGLLEALSVKNRSDIEVNQHKVEITRARWENFRARLAAEAERLRSTATAYQARIQGYSAEVAGQDTQVRSQQETFRIQSANADRQAQLHLQESIAEIDRATKAVTLLIESLKAGSTVASQLAASALSAVTLSGSVSGDDRTTTSFNYQF